LTGARGDLTGWGELDNLVPAYACTIHKSQAANTPPWLIPLLTQHYAMLQRKSGVTPDHRQATVGWWGRESTGDGGEEHLSARDTRWRRARLSSGQWNQCRIQLCLGCASSASLLDRRQSTRADSSTLKQVFRASRKRPRPPPRLCTNSLVSACSRTRPSSTYSRLWCSISPSGWSCWVRKTIGTPPGQRVRGQVRGHPQIATAAELPNQLAQNR